MPKFVIEREIPGVGRLPAESMRTIAQKSLSVLQKMGPSIQWVESFVTDDRIYCVYLAASEDLIREHAQRGGFPANRISRVHKMIDPTTAELVRNPLTAVARSGYRLPPIAMIIGKTGPVAIPARPNSAIETGSDGTRIAPMRATDIPADDAAANWM